MSIKRGLFLIFLFMLAGAILHYVFTDAQVRGVFNPWKNLGAPPEKAILVVGEWIVESASGEKYIYVDSGNWEKVEELPSNLVPGKPVEELNCVSPPSTDRFVDAKGFNDSCVFGTYTVIVAIDSSGTVYRWQVRIEEAMWIVAAPCYGSSMGFVIGMIIVGLAAAKRSRQKYVDDMEK